MRDIKFRAFSKSLNKMLTSEIIKKSSDTIVEILNSKSCLDCKKGLFLSLDNNDLDFMQYTGLKDKNGNEIYEGDILTSDDYPFKDNGNSNYNAEVYWDRDELQFCIQLHCVDTGKRGISHGICEALVDRIDSIEECHFEIIGNIYENSNLLKVN